MMTTFYRLNLGAGNEWLDEATIEGWVGVSWLAGVDFTNRFPATYEEFKKEYRDQIIDVHGFTSNLSAGKACSTIWHVCNRVQVGDVVLVPTNRSSFRAAKVTGRYFYAEGESLAHRRPVEWFSKEIPLEVLSPAVKKALGAPIPLIWFRGYPPDIQKAYDDELTALIYGEEVQSEAMSRLDENVSFVMEKYLEDFLVKNWDKTVLAQVWELIDSQVQTETGPLDILAKSKDGNTVLVIELKLRRASDNVLGQIQRYMGWVKQDLEPGQQVKGLIIGDEMDQRLRLALDVAPEVSFMRYEMDFRLLTDEEHPE